MDARLQIRSKNRGVVGTWKCDKTGWWSCRGSQRGLLNLDFRFAAGANPSDNVSIGGVAMDNDGPQLQSLLRVTTGLRVRKGICETQWSILAEALKATNDPVPLLEHLEVQPTSLDAVSNCILDGVDSRKFSSLKELKWGARVKDPKSPFREFYSEPPREADILCLAKFIRESRLPALTGLSVYFRGYNSSSETAVTSLVNSLQHTPNLQSLSFTGDAMKRGHQALVQIMQDGHLRGLEELNLSGSGMMDTECELYGKVLGTISLQALRTLTLPNNRIGDKGVVSLLGGFISGSFGSLRDLDVSNNRIGKSGADALANAFASENFQSMHSINMKSNKIGQDGAFSLARMLAAWNLPALKSVNIRSNNIGAEGGEAILKALGKGSFQAFQSLDVSNNVIREQGAKALADSLAAGKFKSLVSLHIEGNHIEANGAEALAKAMALGRLPSLQVLDMGNNKIGQKGADAVARALMSKNLSLLQTLSLRSNNIGEKGAEVVGNALRLGSSKSLESLDLSNNNIGKKGVEALSSAVVSGNMQSLEVLSIRSNSIASDGAKDLADALFIGNLKSLENLDLSKNNIGECGAEEIARALGSGNFQSLEILDLGYNRLGIKGAEALAAALVKGNIHSLQVLTVPKNDIGDKGAEALVNALSSDSFQTLLSLNIENNNVGEKGATALAHALTLASFQSLQHLSVRDNNISEEGAKFLSSALGNHQVLQSLYIGSSKIGMKGAEEFATALTLGNLCLESIYIGNNNVGDEGAKVLANALASGNFQSLQILSVGSNNIGEMGANAIAEALGAGNFQSLQIFCAGDNNLGNKGAKALGSAISSGNLQSLQRLYVESNNIGEEGAKEIGNALASGNLQALQLLDVSKNSIKTTGFLNADLPNLRELNLRGNLVGDEQLKVLSDILRKGQLQALDALNVTDLPKDGVTSKGVEALVSAFAENRALVVEVRFEWHLFPELDGQRQDLIKRNTENKSILATLEGKRVQPTFSKIHLCGNLKAGKTTLRKSLQRPFLKSLYAWETRPQEEERTRGIDTSLLVCKGKNPGEDTTTLVIWDLAGQEEYHIIHNAFFSGLTFAEGLATMFVVVCNTSQDRQDLMYWLRFIASSCKGPLSKHVFVVLNCMNGRQPRPDSETEWRELLRNQKQKFQDHLEIHERPFIMDVRKRKSVQDLKKVLLDQSRRMLQNQLVPEICLSIQSMLSVWSQDHVQFPVLEWAEFVQKVQNETRWPENKIDAAARYLHEIGIVVFINCEAQVEWNIPKCKLIVLDLNLLCNQVLGNVFLVTGMTWNSENLFRNRVDERTGSISRSEFEGFFRKLVRSERDCENLVAIMMYLGLCYNGPEQSLIIPALISMDRTRRDCWDRLEPSDGYKKGQWVMGFSVEHTQDDTSLAPMALWNRYQVELAQSREYNGRPQNDFVVGKTFASFTYEEMVVLIQVNRGPNQGSPTFDGIDFLVKPLSACNDDFEVSSRGFRQVDLASILVEIFLKLWERICPRVKYVERVVWPWPAAQSACRLDTTERKRRNVEVTEVRSWVEEHGLGMSMQNWMVGSDRITAGQLLSSKETNSLLLSVNKSNRKLEERVEEAKDEKVFPSDAVLLMKEGWSVESQESTEGGSSSTAGESSTLESVARGIHEHLDRIHGSLKKKLDAIHSVALEIRTELTKSCAFQSDLFQRIKDVGSIFLEAKGNNCPRFIYLGQERSGAWISLKNAMSAGRKVHVHFLCEARYPDYGLHHVEGQIGIDITYMKDWANAVLPWLKVSLTVLYITAKVAANVVAPGLGLAIPGFEAWPQTYQLAEALVLGTGYTKEELDAKIADGFAAEAAGGSHDQPRQLYGRSKQAMTEFFKRQNYSGEEFQSKLGLTKVKLDDKKGRFHGVVWICNKCYESHRNAGRVHDL